MSKQQFKLDKFNISVGTDTEFFLFDTVTQAYKSVVGLVGGMKGFPIPLDDKGSGVEEDNVAVEITTPVVNLVGGGDNLASYIEEIKGKVTQMLPPGYELRTEASVEFNIEELMTPQANMFGCESDRNAWLEGDENPRPEPQGTLRSCGGHVHIGYEDRTPANNIQLVKALDLFLGVPSVQLDPDTKRRSLYGMAGSFREKPYGVEYRVLSNFWTASAEKVKWVFNQIERAVDFINAGETISDELAEEIQYVINNSDIERSILLSQKFSVSLPEKVKDEKVPA